MAVSSFGAAATLQKTEEGLTLVATLSTSVSVSNPGNARYVDFQPKSNTHYILRYVSASSASSTTFPAVSWYNSATGEMGTWSQTVTIPAGTPYIDQLYFNGVSGITQLILQTASASGFIAVYESAQVSQSANFYNAEQFSQSQTSSTYAWGLPGSHPASWLSAGTTISTGLISPQNDYQGILVSTNGGLTWANRGYGVTSGVSVPAVGQNPNFIMTKHVLDGSYGSYYAYSTNGGVSWSTGNYPLSPSGGYGFPTYGNGVYVAVRWSATGSSNGGHMVSTDGINWTHYTNVFLYNEGAYYGSAFWNGEHIVYTGKNSGTIFRSTNGVTWTQSSDTSLQSILEFRESINGELMYKHKLQQGYPYIYYMRKDSSNLNSSYTWPSSPENPAYISITETKDYWVAMAYGDYSAPYYAWVSKKSTSNDFPGKNGWTATSISSESYTYGHTNATGNTFTTRSSSWTSNYYQTTITPRGLTKLS